MIVTIVIITLYVGNVFLCRYLDLWTSKKDIYHNYIPALWFIPPIGLVFSCAFAFATRVQLWKRTPSGKWFFGDVNEEME